VYRVHYLGVGVVVGVGDRVRVSGGGVELSIP
jgi:hypothetical protein